MSANIYQHKITSKFFYYSNFFYTFYSLKLHLKESVWEHIFFFFFSKCRLEGSKRLYLSLYSSFHFL